MSNKEINREVTIKLYEKAKAYYKGYQSIRKIGKNYFENINFYKLYGLATMVSYQIAAKDEEFDEKRLELMKKMLKERIRRLFLWEF